MKSLGMKSFRTFAGSRLHEGKATNHLQLKVYFPLRLDDNKISLLCIFYTSELKLVFPSSFAAPLVITFLCSLLQMKIIFSSWAFLFAAFRFLLLPFQRMLACYYAPKVNKLNYVLREDALHLFPRAIKWSGSGWLLSPPLLTTCSASLRCPSNNKNYLNGMRELEKFTVHLECPESFFWIVESLLFLYIKIFKMFGVFSTKMRCDFVLSRCVSSSIWIKITNSRPSMNLCLEKIRNHSLLLCLQRW